MTLERKGMSIKTNNLPVADLTTTEAAQRRTRRERLIKTIEDIGRHDIKNKLLDVYDQTHNDYNEER